MLWIVQEFHLCGSCGSCVSMSNMAGCFSTLEVGVRHSCSSASTRLSIYFDVRRTIIPCLLASLVPNETCVNLVMPGFITTA